MSKMNLTEATLLALQGKLNLDESVEVEVDNTEVTVQDNSTVIETPDTSVVVMNKQDCSDCTPAPVEPTVEPEDKPETEPEEDKTDVEEITDTVSVEPEEDKTDVEPEEDELDTSSEEKITESKKVEDVSSDKFETFEDFKSSVDKNGGLYGLVSNVTLPDFLIKEIALNGIYELNNDDKIMEDIKERVYDTEVDESKQCNECDKPDQVVEKKQLCGKANKKSFEKVLSDKLGKPVTVNKVSKNENALKVEYTSSDDKNECLQECVILDKLSEGKYFTKYTARKSKMTESTNDNTLNLVTFNNRNNNTMYCVDAKTK